ncbi:tRNA1(Val) (adenine(37)-N6)-methyltransferase [Floccifex sp.]|uniref:tRNA1(Val) (adenine(37)-N6)-methyltransferase n=1 Tax=Floccifex sp. TaxID=2815810 RepID=UPI002A74DAE0|nr:methyltransferase [Floccifex sp.]MDD7281845.1 methyltransferase [Erysipelotrichaceae bacterium]MDY2957522.1 methyltransferase [Floccifex sp.]
MKEYTLDYIVDPNCKLYQDKNMFRMNIDTKLLAQFIKVKKDDNILDIGTNNGALLVYLDQFDIHSLTGVEILPEACQIAQKNADTFIKHPCSIVCSDIKEFQSDLFDVIISNPPFFPINETNPNTVLDNRQLGRIEKNLTLNELVEQANRLLKSKGRFYFVHRCDRLNEITQCLHKYNFSVKTLQIAYHTQSQEAKSICIEAIKDANCKCCILPPKWI